MQGNLSLLQIPNGFDGGKIQEWNKTVYLL